MKRSTAILGFIVILLIALGGTYGLLHYKGYTILNGKVVRTATLKVSTQIIGTKVFVDQFPSGASTSDNEMITVKGVSPERHNILVAKEGYWPWSKVLDFSENGVVTVDPFITVRSPNFVPVATSSTEFTEVKNKITSRTLPTSEKPLISKDQTVTLWMEGGVIKARVNGGDIEDIYTSNLPVKEIDFYRERTDIIVFGTDQGISAIELDKTSNQNLQPIVTSPNDGFYIDSTSGLLYIFVNKAIFSLSL
jgi:hypothetical protein